MRRKDTHEIDSGEYGSGSLECGEFTTAMSCRREFSFFLYEHRTYVNDQRAEADIRV